MNISVAKHGEEECDTCEKYNFHEHDFERVDEGPVSNIVVDFDKLLQKDHPKADDNCKQCSDWQIHISKANLARNAYREDKKKQGNANEQYFAADLEKMIMLPRLPGMKSAIFTRRIILFNETFAPLGHGKPYGYIWHEATR